MGKKKQSKREKSIEQLLNLIMCVGRSSDDTWIAEMIYDGIEERIDKIKKNLFTAVMNIVQAETFKESKQFAIQEICTRLKEYAEQQGIKLGEDR